MWPSDLSSLEILECSYSQRGNEIGEKKNVSLGLDCSLRMRLETYYLHSNTVNVNNLETVTS